MENGNKGINYRKMMYVSCHFILVLVLLLLL